MNNSFGHWVRSFGAYLLKFRIFHFSIKDGVFRQFRGSRKTKDFLDFIEDKQWETIDPMSKWQDPGKGFFKGLQNSVNFKSQVH